MRWDFHSFDESWLSFRDWSCSWKQVWLMSVKEAQAKIKSPVGFGESLVVWKFIQRLPVDCPPDLRFRVQVGEQTFTHQTHLRVWPRATFRIRPRPGFRCKTSLSTWTHIGHILTSSCWHEHDDTSRIHTRFTLTQKDDERTNKLLIFYFFLVQLWFCVFGSVCPSGFVCLQMRLVRLCSCCIFLSSFCWRGFFYFYKHSCWCY